MWEEFFAANTIGYEFATRIAAVTTLDMDEILEFHVVLLPQRWQLTLCCNNVQR